MHAAPDQQPGQRRHHGQQHEPAAPACALHQPGQRRSGKQQPQSAHAHGNARHKGKACAGEMPGDEHGARQKRRCTAHANQQLPQHQPRIVGRPGRERRADDGQRERAQHGAAQADQIHADAHEKLCDTERQAKQAGKRAQRRRGQAKVVPQAGGHDGGDGAVGLAQCKGREQRQQHEPERGGGGRRRLCVVGLSAWRLRHVMSLHADWDGGCHERERRSLHAALKDPSAAPRFRETAPRRASCANSSRPPCRRCRA